MTTVIPIKIPDTCPSCRAWPLSRVTIDGAGGAFARVQVLNERQAQASSVIGGPEFLCQPYICRACGFIALYYDHKATERPKKL